MPCPSSLTSSLPADIDAELVGRPRSVRVRLAYLTQGVAPDIAERLVPPDDGGRAWCRKCGSGPVAASSATALDSRSPTQSCRSIQQAYSPFMSDPYDVKLTQGHVLRHVLAESPQGRDAAVIDIAQDLLLRHLSERGSSRWWRSRAAPCW